MLARRGYSWPDCLVPTSDTTLPRGLSTMYTCTYRDLHLVRSAPAPSRPERAVTSQVPRYGLRQRPSANIYRRVASWCGGRNVLRDCSTWRPQQHPSPPGAYLLPGRDSSQSEDNLKNVISDNYQVAASSPSLGIASLAAAASSNSTQKRATRPLFCFFSFDSHFLPIPVPIAGKIGSSRVQNEGYYPRTRTQPPPLFFLGPPAGNQYPLLTCSQQHDCF